MPDAPCNPRRFFLKLAAHTGLFTLSMPRAVQAALDQSKKFEWLPSECADKRFPMMLVSGLLLARNDEIAAVIPTGKIINNGWGEFGSIRIEGALQKPIPEHLKLTWFSFTENQFYGGSIPLPHALLRQLFEEGFATPLTRERSTWHRIIVGMGLGGWVSVWLAGDGLVREVATARLEQVSQDWSTVLNNPAIPRAEFIRSTLTKRLSQEEFTTLEKNGPPVSTWPRRARRQRWRLLVDGKADPLHIFVRSFNGERHFHEFSQSAPLVLEPIPRFVQITYLSPSGSKLMAEISIDETEIFDAFDKAKHTATEPVTLRFTMEARSQITIALESTSSRMTLQRSRIQIGSLS
ncbi:MULTISPECIES: DUF2931 family protein [Deefgea]|uniref:DUF2931 family protein n=1 Tax=Deefgea chitinilytica TaxID=570276 RepID=A0ABS2CE51_9NEIS|nr:MULTISPECIES: DUF2931 family protein [Deefgea]MBM5571671.1 DUF2931 family protein [Deefgea chitinilytica]MBM9888906.1 DUF2931 family protein [Deefgea sp. CFH1-16]